MLLDSGAVSGRGDAKAGTMPGVPVRERRRRRSVPIQELATPIAATFLGLLLVHNLDPAVGGGEAQARTGNAGPDPDGRAADDPVGETASGEFLAGAGQTPALGGAALAGALDLGGLAGPFEVTSRSADSEPYSTSAVSTTVASAAASAAGSGATLTFASLPAPTTATGDPAAETETTAEEVVGPIGRYVRGDGTDGTTVLTDGDDIFIGGDGDEHVIGGAGDDYIDGAAGDDWLEGGTGDDTLLGGDGSDRLEGNAGDDLLDGGAGDDVLLGGPGDDNLLGGGGDDFLNGGAGIDRLAGGTGNEVLVLADVRDSVTELGLGADAGGNDTVVVADSYARSLATALSGTGGKATFVLGRPDIATFPGDVAGFRQQIDPDIENIRLEGNTAHDVVGDDHGSLIVGNDGANRIYAGGGDDAIYAGRGDDFIDAGAGNDWLDGGLGDDVIYGGAGDDVFVLGLQESGDILFDHEGQNSLRLLGADPGKLSLDRHGDDLQVTHDGKVVATVADFAGHQDSIVGIDLGQGVRPLSDFMPDDGAMATAARAADDWLAEYTPQPGLAEPLPEPWAALDLAETATSSSTMVQAGAELSAPSVPSTFGALPADHAAADLWLPMDDALPMSGAPVPETERVDHHGEERHANG